MTQRVIQDAGHSGISGENSKPDCSYHRQEQHQGLHQSVQVRPTLVPEMPLWAPQDSFLLGRIATKRHPLTNLPALTLAAISN